MNEVNEMLTYILKELDKTRAQNLALTHKCHLLSEAVIGCAIGIGWLAYKCFWSSSRIRRMEKRSGNTNRNER